MKRYLYLVLLSVVFSTGRAQMLDDGTANVVNYWAVGDSAVYEMHTMDYKVVEGDTTVTKDLVERFSLQLTDTLPNGDMIFEYSELQSPDKAKKEAEKLINEKFKGIGDIKVQLLTDRLGTFKGINNCDKVIEILNNSGLRDSLRVALLNEKAIELPETVNRDSLVNFAVDIAFSDRSIRKMLGPVIGLFAFNGKNVQLGENFTGLSKQPTIFDEQSYVDVKSNISFSSMAERGEGMESMILIRYDNLFDSDQLTAIALKTFGRVVTDKEIADKARKAYNNPEMPYAFINETGYQVIDADSGTVILYSNTMTAYVNNKYDVRSFSIEYLTEEELAAE